MEMPLLARYWREGRRLAVERHLSHIEAARLAQATNESYRERVGQLIEMTRTERQREASERGAVREGWAAARARARKKV